MTSENFRRFHCFEKVTKVDVSSKNLSYHIRQAQLILYDLS